MELNREQQTTSRPQSPSKTYSQARDFLIRQQQDYYWLSRTQQQEEEESDMHQRRKDVSNNPKKIYKYIVKQQREKLQRKAQGSSLKAENIVLDFLHTVMQCLSEYPGQFEVISVRFVTIFEAFKHNEYVMSIAMEDIFQKSIQGPQFRGMGAKLYNLLYMLDRKHNSLFYTLLKCKLDHQQQEVVQYLLDREQRKVRQTALFLVELYMRLRSDESRIRLIAESIVYSLQKLLALHGVPTGDNVRCICQTLTLAGYDLTLDCDAEMRQIVAQLDAIETATPGKYVDVDGVLQLQRSNWGRKVQLEKKSESLSGGAGLTSNFIPMFLLNALCLTVAILGINFAS